MFICSYFQSLMAGSYGTAKSLRDMTPSSALLLRPAGNRLSENDMGKKGKKGFNIFALASRILRVGREVTGALSDDGKISDRERDVIIAVLLEEISSYLDEIMG
tara:strand:+ start:198 stop:509 length:312 start_codon:yes stop_codon:yes gene_type:complete